MRNRILTELLTAISAVVLLCVVSQASAYQNQKADYPVDTITSPNLGNAPAGGIPAGTSMLFNFNVKTKVTVAITRTDLSPEQQVYQETFSSSSGSIIATRNIHLEAGDYRIDERYHIEAAPDILPSFTVFSADPQFSWNAAGAVAGDYTLSVNVVWHDVSAIVSGDFTTDPSPVQVSGNLGSSINDVRVICSDGLDPNERISVSVHFTGKLDKNTKLTSGVTGPVISDPKAVPSSVSLDGETPVLLTASVTGTNISSVTVDLSPIGGGASQEMYDDGTNGDVKASDGVYSFQTIPFFGITGGDKELTVTATDTNGTAHAVIALTIERGPIVSSTSVGGGAGRGNRGAQNLQVHIHGYNFDNGDGLNVLFTPDGITVKGVTYLSSTELVATIDISQDTSLGGRYVTVVNPDGRTGMSSLPVFEVVDAPYVAVDTVYPDHGNQGASNLMVQITGANFVSGCSISFDISPGVPDSNITVTGPTTVNGTGTVIKTYIEISSAAPLGGRYVTVTNPGGASATSASPIFTVVGAPSITSVSPSSGELGSSISVIITGVNLVGNNSISGGLIEENLPTISFGAVPITVSSLSYVDTTQISATFDLTAEGLSAGTYTFTITNPGGIQTSNQCGFTVVSPPTVTGASPGRGNLGASNLDVQITGSDFVDGATVEFSGTGITVNSVTFNSSTSLTVNIDISSTAALGKRDIKVTNPGIGTTPAVGNDLFEVVGPPSITSVSPSQANRGAYITHFTVTGTNFVGTPTITFSGDGITVVSVNSITSTTLDVNIQISPTATEGIRNITVTNAGGVSVTRNNAFNVLGDVTVTGVNPSSLNRGVNNINLTISGTNFMNGVTVSFNGTGITVNSVTYNSPTSLTVNVDVSPSASLGSRNVTVTNPYSISRTGANLFTVLGSVDVTGISPDVASTGGSGMSVTITGNNFTSGATVTIGGCAVTSAVVVDSHTINAVLNVTGGAGTYDVTVTNPGGSTDTLSNGFTILAAPAVTDISPSSGSQGATNMDVVITGERFVPGASVSFSGGGITVNSTSVDATLTKIYANITIDSTAGLTSRSVTVTNPGGVSVTKANAFTVIGPPAVVSISPASANIGVTGLSVTVQGSNFTSDSQVSFGAGVNVLSATFINSGRIDVTISIDSTAPLGLRDVTVTNPGNVVGIGSNMFTVLSGLTVTSISPNRANRGATLVVSIYGGGFNSSITAGDVSFGSGVTVNSLSYVSQTELSAEITVDGTATIGLRDVSVTVDGVTANGDNLFHVLGAPTVSSITPSSGSRGASMMSITIEGSNFVEGADVKFESSSGIAVHSAVVDSSSRITALISISPSSPLKKWDVTVINPGNVQATGSDLFEVIGSPSITSLSPSSGNRGMPSYDVTINGSNFVEGAVASFDNSGITVNSTTFVNSSQLIANIDISSTAALGACDVTVSNPGGVSATEDNAFTVLHAAPQVLSANPSTGSKSTTLDVQITGTNFQSGATISFSGIGITVNSVSFVDSQDLLVNITIASNAPSGLRNITLTNPDGQSDTGIGLFSVGSELTVSSISPSSASPGTTLDVTITGTGFQSNSSASFGSDITVNSISYISSTQIKVNITISPSASQGSRDVSVSNPGGATATLQDGFTVTGSATLAIQDSNGNSTIYASVGDRIDLRLYLQSSQNINGVAAYLTYDTSVLEVADVITPFNQGGFLGGTVLDNDRHGDPGNGISGGQLDYVEVNHTSSATGSGVVATFQLEVIGTPPSGYTTVSFDFDEANGRVTALSVAGDGTLTPATINGKIYIGSAAPTGGTTISGKVQLQSRTNHSAQVTIEVRSHGGTVPLEKRVINTSSDGSYTLNLTTPAGTYDIAAKADGFLRQTLQNVTIPSSSLNFSLLAGDADGDNDVDLKDFNVLSASFGSVQGDPNYNSSCDFNGNDTVDLSDFAVLASNFLKAGDAAPDNGKTEDEFDLKLSSVIAGQEAKIALKGDVSSLYAYAVQIEFDPEQLQLRDAEPGDLLSGGKILYHIKIERPGLATVLASLIEEKSGLNGKGDLLRLTFRVNSWSEDTSVKLLNGISIRVRGSNEVKIGMLPKLSLILHAVPEATSLGQNYPNPFNPETWIPFRLSERAEVKIRIFDVSGKLVRVLDLGKLEPGYYEDRSRAAYWDGRNEIGEKVTSGVYIYQLLVGDRSFARKMVILK
ncbi:IPT/TIG domain-containing protein [Candidatus Poribacteria bacterium]|nr:IPT/TIG domain-containing protein [Candidatus Poribacteria bacterium]